MRDRDNQRSKVYKWENVAIWNLIGEPKVDQHWHRGRLITTVTGGWTLDECQRFINKVWRAHLRRRGYASDRFSPPRVKDGRGTRIARGGSLYINLPKWARWRGVVIHELAHSMQPRGTAPHGPEYVAVFIDLLARHAGLSRRELRRTAREHRVKVERKRR